MEVVVWRVFKLCVGAFHASKWLENFWQLGITLNISFAKVKFKDEGHNSHHDEDLSETIRNSNSPQLDQPWAIAFGKADLYIPDRCLVPVGHEFAPVVLELQVGREVCRAKLVKLENMQPQDVSTNFFYKQTGNTNVFKTRHPFFADAVRLKAVRGK